jgi:hypothetical protein
MGKDTTESHSGNEDGYLEPLDPERDSGMAGNNAMGNNENIYTLNRGTCIQLILSGMGGGMLVLLRKS